MIQIFKQAATVVLTSFLLVGCATTKDSILPHDLKPMKQIYDEHFEQTSNDMEAKRNALQRREKAERDASSVDHAVGASTAGYPIVHSDHYLQNEYREIAYRFPRLRNPDLVMFVYPHLAGEERVPIPGYLTVFPLYERTEYALPGEPTRR